MDIALVFFGGLICGGIFSHLFTRHRPAPYAENHSAFKPQFPFMEDS